MSMHSEVKVSYLSPEEHMKYLIGAKCELKYRPKGRDWKWRFEKATEASVRNDIKIKGVRTYA